MSRSDLHVVLVEPEIHWNTGNAGRTCLAVGARLHLVGPLGFSLDAAEVRRAGLDYWPRVRPCLWPDWSTFEAGLDDPATVAFFSPDGAKPLWDADLSAIDTLVFGAESRGLPADVRKRYGERLVAIPQQPDAVRSLNLSTAVAVALYEAWRQQKPPTSVERARPPDRSPRRR